MHDEAVIAHSTDEMNVRMVTESVRYDLECSDMTIKEIAAKYDFPNLSFFGKYTKRQLGMSPTEYRRQRGRGKCK